MLLIKFSKKITMKHLLIFIFSCCSLSVFGQALPVMLPTLGKSIEKSTQGEIDFYEMRKKCEKFWEQYQADFDFSQLNEAEKKLLDFCETAQFDYWDVLSPGCSWYCGGGLDTVTASSYLKAEGSNQYLPKNIHDFSYKTPWVEGVPGYGIGESISCHFPPENPRITEIIIVNGYVKSEQAWKDNSRVRKLKMYLNNKPYAMLILEDSRKEQHFKFEPLGYDDRDDNEALLKQPWWTIKFEIVEVYPGDKFDDTALSEIYFDGIDVH